MIVKQIKLYGKSKERLSRLKGKTGIQNWNILCRWALCYSLSESTIPTEQDNSEIDKEKIVEMSWGTFGGEYEEIYEMLVKERCLKDGLDTDPDTVAKYFLLHLNRGIAYLSGTNVIRNIDDLFELATEKAHEYYGDMK